MGIPPHAFVLTMNLLLLSAGPGAVEPGKASGSGTIDRIRPNPAAPDQPTTEKVPFTARTSWAYHVAIGGKTYTWLVLADQEPPAATYLYAANLNEARRTWCARARASFVAVMLTPEGEVNLTELCAGDGEVNTEMLSRANGLDSTVVTLTSHDRRHLAGALRMGRGSCPGAGDQAEYCEKTGDFVFDAPFVP